MSPQQQPVDAETLKQLILQDIPGSQVFVHAYQGTDHFEMIVISDEFAGKPLVAQHQIVYQTLGDQLRRNIHALALKTYTLGNWKKINIQEKR